MAWEQSSQEKASHGLSNDYVGYNDDVYVVMFPWQLLWLSYPYLSHQEAIMDATFKTIEKQLLL